MTELVVHAGTLVQAYSMVEKASVIVRNGVIVGVERGFVRASNVLDYRDYIVVPGLLDTHIHGVQGYDTMRGTDNVVEMSRRLVRYGVTGFLPSTVTASHEELVEACRGVAEAFEEWSKHSEPLGARILGVHLEGPYVSQEKAGAQNPEHIRNPSIDEVREYYEASRRLLRMMTLAPELPGALELIRWLRMHGVTVSLGHTNADYETARLAIANGARRATHLYNAMRAVHHREPGVVGAVLEDPRVYLELIVDLVHVHPAVVRETVRRAGPHRVVLITDAIEAAGLPDGEYSLGGLKVIVKNGIARLETGALAGSTLTLDRAVANMTRLGISLEEAVAMASFNPARSLGLEGLGDIAPGYHADFTVLTRELKVKATVIAGIEVYRSHHD